jgi:hypothetical protein
MVAWYVPAYVSGVCVRGLCQGDMVGKLDEQTLEQVTTYLKHFF